MSDDDNKHLQSAKPVMQVDVGNQTVDLVLGATRTVGDDIYARWPNGHTESFHGHKVLVTTEIEEHNYLKDSSMSGSMVRGRATCQVFMNAKLVYAFTHRTAVDCIVRLPSILDELREHPLEPWDAEKRKQVVGRKIWYEHVPAVITSVFWVQGAVCFEAEGDHRFPQPHWSKGENPTFPPGDGTVGKDDILSQRISWYRDV